MQEKHRWPTRREFEEQELEVLRAFAPDVEQCELCGYAVIDGYACMRCGACGGEMANFSEYHTEREAREARARDGQ